jgi:uncharacterized Zn finger protein (UPF0148 family)
MKHVCKCTYYRLVDGKLFCAACGKPAPEKPAVEDKVVSEHETKEVSNG